MIKAVIFDVDGVLVDSEGASLDTAGEVFKQFGVKMTKKEYKNYTGVNLREIVKIVSKKRKVKIDPDQFIKARYDLYEKYGKKTIKPFSGAKTFISMLRRKKVKIAVATAGNKRKLSFNLKCGEFDIRNRVTADDIKHGKPAPDIFLAAAKKLKVKPNECIVVEDSLNGIKAAKKAKMFCVAVTNTFPRSKLKDADLIIDSLSELKW
jgi:HAD superfamily hydrolase (TIGR01509 family)